MKFYETHYEDYYHSVEKYNFHPLLEEQYKKFPKHISGFENTIVYGPGGSGKYSQVLYLLKRYSPSQLKYEKKITACTEKQSYTYKISDIHYEIDMALLGCNSKQLWHEIFIQIVDIVSMKNDNKFGVIVCKKFHSIHNELLEIFYSYIQQYPGPRYGPNSGYNLLGTPIQIKFVLLTEHVSFIPNNIINRCYVLNVPRPDKNRVKDALGICKSGLDREQMTNILDQIESENVTNHKELYSFVLVKSSLALPRDNFNTICDAVIDEMEQVSSMSIARFRDHLYDMLIYNLDIFECVWYIFSYFMKRNVFSSEKLESLLPKMYLFFRQYSNNYRTIFHLENIFFLMIVHK